MASGVTLITKGDAVVVAITVAIVSLAFGALFTYILRREVKLPHGEGVRLISLVRLPWSRGESPYRVENGKVVSNEEALPGDT